MMLKAVKDLSYRPQFWHAEPDGSSVHRFGPRLLVQEFLPPNVSPTPMKIPPMFLFYKSPALLDAGETAVTLCYPHRAPRA